MKSCMKVKQMAQKYKRKKSATGCIYQRVQLFHLDPCSYSAKVKRLFARFHKLTDLVPVFKP